MSDLRQQLQKHYDAQVLPAAKVDAILAEGRAATAGGEKVVEMPKRRIRIWPIVSTIAACVMLWFAMGWKWFPRHYPVSYAAFAPRIVEFFGTPPELPKRSQNPEGCGHGCSRRGSRRISRSR